MGTTGKHAAKIPGNGGYLNEGPDLEPKKPTTKYDKPTASPIIGGPSDRNNNGIDDSEE